MLMAAGIQVDAHGQTDIGRERRDNEDQFLVAALHKVVEITHTSLPDPYRTRFDSGARALLLLVADGVGGTARGGEASSITLDTIVHYVTNSMRCFYKLDEQVQQELLDSGAFTADEAEQSPLSQVLTRAIGGEGSESLPEIGQVALEPGDALLLCTDGLTKHVPDAAISRLLASSATATATREALIGAALEGGGSDNVTVVVGRFAA